MWGVWCACILELCYQGGSLSLKPNEQIARRFIRNDIVVWMRRLRLLHYPSITSDVLQINYQAATSSCWEADLIDESKNSPMAIPAYTAPSFQYSSQCLSQYKGTHINTITSRGWCVRVCTLTEKNKHTICLQTWDGKSASTRHERWKVKSKGPFSQRTADVRLYLPLQTAPGFIPHRRWQIDWSRAYILGVLM